MNPTRDPWIESNLIKTIRIVIFHFQCTCMMHPTSRLLQYSARITLFTRSQCSLCETAKATIEHLAKRRSFEFNTVNVMAAGQQRWKDLYEFDTPVVRSWIPRDIVLRSLLTGCRSMFREFTILTPNRILSQKRGS